ncbi:MAG: HAMP domain-containing sensor histidine kinase [Polyangiaceae bacterium]
MRRPFWSLRASVALLVVGVVVAPLLLVAGWLGVERRMEASMKSNAAFALTEAIAALGPAPLSTATVRSTPAERLEQVASTHRVRIRIVDQNARVLHDHDFDSGHDLSERAGGVVLRREKAVARPSADESFGPLPIRPEVREALRGGSAQGCHDSAESGIVLCYAARALDLAGARCVLHIQDSAGRPLPLLYELRFQLGRLTLMIMPFALLLALWAGRQLVFPFEQLRDQVLLKVSEARPTPNLEQRKSIEQAQLAQAFNTVLQRLNERRAANEAFVADLVHEFKNPVAAIRACGESLADGPLTPERAQRLSRLVQESAGRLDVLVSQFLELARAEAGMLSEAWEPVDLGRLAQARVERARDDERWPSLEFQLQVDSDARVRGVAERLEAVLDNLLANAASFARSSGVVHVSVRRSGSDVVLSVRDDGPGIAPEDIPHVFERFYTTRRHDKGTGLGLALVRAIVEAHGGQVGVDSELGRGARFSAAIPAIV